ncbi:MAG TPA: nitrate ABC transporter substrate-binding protein [Pseudomonas sp.]|jgi:sulfonate transport system substrate-binding protein|uniref:Nitrate ABC transporter substrate-binding protein n=1 Tax=Pseudomonas helleri TaxID=1608996 RepID=A0A6A7Z502_9PSED|nr:MULTISPECIES: ABC transporter substrate-binding protein [Pseudomonas]MDU7556779.1 ABC transporter substrate-binding protein [Pseudomonas sp.]MQT36046.1 nitrate ABC transporter substrate-binding protein [Pseudomonas helleri]MQT39348.1 nitrate ABC transporter substrate-binding protein [Pseudomonas sp. FSL R10-0765]MQT54504.1 nitrate ABC transporter substrate-binding protein [Pseudomonas sp. FSL R10-2398]MQU01401.1 nitrate ABC transporter substrate-binding protein [Pseudomonas sp. FSL R10-2245
MKFSRFLLSPLLMLGLLASSASYAAEPLKTVRIATVAYSNAGKITFNGPTYLMDKDPWLKEQLAQRGVELQWVPAATASVGTFVNEEFANKRIDFAFYGDLPSIILNASGVATQLIAAGGIGNNVYLVVPPDSTATSIDDLKGKRVALHRGRPWELSFAKLLESRNLAFDDFRLFNLNPQAGGAALSAGRIDGLFTLSDAFLLEDKKVGKIIWSSKQAPLDWKMRAELFGAKDFIAQNPEVTQLVVDAYLKALKWASQDEHKAEYIALLSQSGQPQSVLLREVQGEAWKDHFSPLINATLRQHYADGIAYSLQSKLIRKDVNVDNLLDDRFVKQGLKNLNLTEEWK